jgi:thiamine biosynthesis protein ThiS
MPQDIAVFFKVHGRIGTVKRSFKSTVTMTIRLNGDPYDLPGPTTVSALLERLQIDHRRVAVELNLTVLKRATFDSTPVREGDEVEIVNFVGGGTS